MPSHLVRGTIIYPFEYYVDGDTHTAESILAEFGSGYNFGRYAFRDDQDDLWVMDSEATISVESVLPNDERIGD